MQFDQLRRRAAGSRHQIAHGQRTRAIRSTSTVAFGRERITTLRGQNERRCNADKVTTDPSGINAKPGNKIIEVVARRAFIEERDGTAALLLQASFAIGQGYSAVTNVRDVRAARVYIVQQFVAPDC